MLSHEIQLGPKTEYAKEMRKWEGLPGPYGMPGRPYEYRAYPTMLYRPTRAKDSGTVTYDEQIAGDDAERARWEAQGFVHGGKGAALAHLERQEFEFAELAANRAVTDKRMGELAREEGERIDSATIQHLPVIPETRDRAEHMSGKKPR